MNTCKNCGHDFESQSESIQVCPMCGEPIDTHTVDIDESEQDVNTIDEFFELDEGDAETSSVDEFFEFDDDVERDEPQQEIDPEETFVSTQDTDHVDDLIVPKIPLHEGASTQPVDSEPFAVTEHATFDQDGDDDEFELVDDDKTELATEFYDPDEKQPTVEIQNSPVTASSLDYAEREIIGLNSGDSPAEDGDYVISINDKDSQLGSGASGVVYKATQKSLDRTVAIKLLKKQVQAGTQSQSRKTTPKQKDIEKFLYESQITAGLDHPNVITVHDLGVTSNDTLFYSMKLFEGGKDWSKDFDKNSLEQNLDIFNDVCDAMRRAHRDRIIHRDLKPQNVLVGDFGEVQVTDWGLAIDLKIEQGNEFSGGGTPCYMAPEMSNHYIAQQEFRGFKSKLDWTLENAPDSHVEIDVLKEKIAENKERESRYRNQIGELSDVYVLGAILFQIASGYPPHLFQISETNRKQWGSETGKNKVRRELLMSANGKIANYLVKNLPNPEARAALRDIAIKAMAELPEKRIASVADLQLEVRDFRDFMRCIEDTQRGDREVKSSDENPKSYVNLNNAIYAYEGALENYPEYEPANAGLAKATFLFAERALTNQDFELGLSTMTDEAIEQQPNTPLARKLRDELATQRNRRDRRKRLLFIATMASLVSIALGVIFGLYAAVAAKNAANALANLHEAQIAELETKNDLLVGLSDLKTAKEDSIDLKIKKETGELELDKIRQEKTVASTEAEILTVEKNIQKKESEFDTAKARFLTDIAEFDKQLAELDKIQAQIASEKIKEDTQYNQYVNRLRTIERNIDEEVTKKHLQELFDSDDISTPVKNAWELHHLYKQANTTAESIGTATLSDFKMIDSDKNGETIIALAGENQLLSFSNMDKSFSKLEIEGLNDPSAKILALDVSADGRWLIVARNTNGKASTTGVESLPVLFDLQNNISLPFDKSVVDKMRFLATAPDSKTKFCKEKYFCKVQHVEFLRSSNEQIRIFMVDQRAPTGVNQLRCSVMDLDVRGSTANGDVKRAKMSGQLFLKSPGLLTETGCLATAIEADDGSVVAAVANSHPSFAVSVFSIDAADELLGTKSNIRTRGFETKYFSQLKNNSQILNAISPDFAPTAIELIQPRKGEFELLVGNGKGEIAQLKYMRNTDRSFVLAVDDSSLLKPTKVDSDININSQVVSNRKYRLNESQNRNDVLYSTVGPHNTIKPNNATTNAPIHKSPVRQIQKIGSRLFSTSETEILVWNFENESWNISKKLFGQSGKIAALCISTNNEQTELLTVSNIKGKGAELRRWKPDTSDHDSVVQLDNFKNDRKTSKRIVTGTADKSSGSNAVALAFDDGTFEYFSPTVGTIHIDRPASANLPDKQDDLSLRDFRNGKFEFLPSEQRLLMYSNSIGMLQWNLGDPSQTDPIRSQQAAQLYRGIPENSSVFFSSDAFGENIVTSHPQYRDRFVLWQLRDETEYVATEIGPLEKHGGQYSDQLNVVVQPAISPDGNTIACVLRLRNSYQVQLIQTSPTRNQRKLFMFDSDSRTNFRSVKFLGNQHIAISEDRVGNGAERKTSIVNLIESQGTWTDSQSEMPKLLYSVFRQVSVADIAKIGGETTYAGFGIPVATSKSNSDDSDCGTSAGNRNLIVWNDNGLLYRRIIPFSRRIAPKFRDGKLLYFVAGDRGQKGVLEFKDLADRDFNNSTVAETDYADVSSPGKQWHLLGDNNVVVTGDDWFYLANLENDKIDRVFEFSRTNAADRIELAKDKLLIHHADKSVSLVELAKDNSHDVKRIPGFHDYVGLSPDGQTLAYLDSKQHKIGISKTADIGTDDFLNNADKIDEPAVAITWINKSVLPNLGVEDNGADEYVLATATLGERFVKLKFWNSKGERLAAENDSTELPIDIKRDGTIRSFDFANGSGRLASITWKTDKSDRADIWKYSMTRKPAAGEIDDDVGHRWFLVDDSNVGTIDSVHFSEVSVEGQPNDEIAQRIVISSDNLGSKSVRLFALELGLEFTTKPLLDLIVIDKLQQVDEIVGARFTGDGKTLLTMTSERAQVRLTDGWDHRMKNVDFNNKIRQFQVAHQSKDPQLLIQQRDELKKKLDELGDSPDTGQFEQLKIELAEKLNSETKNLEVQTKDLNTKRATIESDIKETVQDEINKISSDIVGINAEIAELKTTLSASENN